MSIIDGPATNLIDYWSAGHSNVNLITFIILLQGEFSSRLFDLIKLCRCGRGSRSDRQMMTEECPFHFIFTGRSQVNYLATFEEITIKFTTIFHPLTPANINLFDFKCPPWRLKQTECYREEEHSKSEEEEANLECLLIRICDMQMWIPWMAGIPSASSSVKLTKRRYDRNSRPDGTDSRFAALAVLLL